MSASSLLISSTLSATLLPTVNSFESSTSRKGRLLLHESLQIENEREPQIEPRGKNELRHM